MSARAGHVARVERVTLRPRRRTPVETGHRKALHTRPRLPQFSVPSFSFNQVYTPLRQAVVDKFSALHLEQ